MKKKILLALMVMVLGILAFGAVGVSADTYGDLTYSVSNGKATITDCNTSASGELVIPDNLGGYPVTTIGYEAFYDCYLLTSVTIPDSVTTIGYEAFFDCAGLASITIPDSVTTIGDYAFYNCTGLTRVTIGDGVTTIGNYAFCNCTGLASVTIPDSVTTIGNYAFYDCTGLTSVTIGNGVTSIGVSAFRYCTGLTSVTIGNGVTSIDNWAFEYCTGLTRVDITDLAAWCNIYFVSSYSNPLYYADKLYLNNELITNLVIPDGVTEIKDCAFYSCGGLISITIPDSVTSIGSYAFSYCTGLTRVTIGNGVTTIGYQAFSNCDGLTRVDITDLEAWCNIDFGYPYPNPLYYAENLYLNNELITNLVIPDGVTEIEGGAFYYCRSLTSVTIPDSVTSIGSSAFYNCTGLTSVTIGKGAELIPEKAFYSCNNLKTVCIPAETKYIRNDAFNNCSNIETVFYAGSESGWNEILFYNRNENLTNAKIIYNATQKTYKFETNCNTILPDITNYAIFSSPTVKNEGKTLIGWYDNEKLSGEAVTFPYYGSATTLYAAWTDRTGKTFDDALIAKENSEYNVTTTESGQIAYFEFVPKYTGEYRIYSTGSLDTYGYLYNSSKNQITYDDDDGAGNNFYIERELTAGATYYIGAKIYSGSGTFTLVIETDCVPATKTVCVSAADGRKIFMTIPNYLPEDAQVILACYKGGKATEIATAPNKSETIYFIADEEFDTVKVMVWESFESLKPLCDVELVQ